MRTTGFLIAAGGALAISACAIRPEIADRPPLELRVEPTGSAFQLSLANPSSYDRCIVQENWPTRGGQLHFASEQVFVEDDGRRFPIRDENTGYCLYCELRIPAGSSITATLPYAEFPSLPDSPPGPHATLTLPVIETSCRASS
ncbi:MAG TPA: hypothetical protein VN018_04175 [Brevundimonas sp.]|nr:hypothetical protein [Brevundimonas sp.]